MRSSSFADDLVEVWHSRAGGDSVHPVELSGESSAGVVPRRAVTLGSEPSHSMKGLSAGGTQGCNFHAGTSRSADGEWLTAGGRVLGITASARTLDRSLHRCYDAVSEIHWDGMQYRRDIGRFTE